MTELAPGIRVSHVLIPIDQSSEVRTAVDFALLVARSLGATITLLHVTESPHAMIGIVPGATVDGELELASAIAVRSMAELVADLHARGFTPVTAVTTAGPSVTAAIVGWAKQHAVDLIVMATHARVGVSRLVLGSVTESVLRHAECPVVTVHIPHA